MQKQQKDNEQKQLLNINEQVEQMMKRHEIDLLQQNYDQQQQQQIQMYQQEDYGYSNQPSKPLIRMLGEKVQENSNKIAAVIVSFVSGQSYDQLFTSVQQKSQEGTRVVVYSCLSTAIEVIMKEFQGQKTQNQVACQLITHINQVDPDCVVFNWQCCQGYQEQTFKQGSIQLFQFVKYVISKGHMTMFSDFSLKSLIKQWNAEQLGPPPFVKLGQTSNSFNLYFNKTKLQQCPSAQLQIVGQMSQAGKCYVQAFRGTIVYSINKNQNQNQNNFYKAQILTIAQTDFKDIPQAYQLQINEIKGVAGHILLSYKSGGYLLASMGHWIQLMKVDTTERKLFEMAEKNYGVKCMEQMKQQYAGMNRQQQKQYVYKNAVQFVQKSAPCSNMAKKMNKRQL